MGPGGLSLLSLPKGQGLGQYGSVECFKFLWFGWFLLHWIPGQKGSPRWNLRDKPSPRAAVQVRLKCSEYGRRQSSSRLQLSCPAVYHSWLLVHIQGLSQLRPWLKVCGNSTTSRKSCHRLPVAFRGLQARATLSVFRAGPVRGEVPSHQAGPGLARQVLGCFSSVLKFWPGPSKRRPLASWVDPLNAAPGLPATAHSH